MTRFLELHRPGTPLICPNPWDVGSARILEHLGFAALATTSSGFAASLGRLDGGPGRDASVAHAAALAAAVSVPVSADLEDCYADPAETVAMAAATGLAGASIEDWDGARLHGRREAVARVAAAVGAAGDLVITARAENHIRGVDDLDDTIARLQAYAAAGAHVVYAPGLVDLGDIERVVSAVPVPVNVLLRPGGPSVPQLAAVGVARVTVGGAFAFAAYGALAELGRELLDTGAPDLGRLAGLGSGTARAAFAD
jgi:2-methylisocitrate lyase-like PEP mutase family enzyme